MKKHHTKYKGDVAAAKAISDLTEKGYKVFTPVVTEHLPFDLIAYKDSKLFKIQCKFASSGKVSSKTSWSDKNGTHERRYKAEDFDYYAIYLPNVDKVIYPHFVFAGSTVRSTISNSPVPFYWYEDFLNFTNKAKKKTYKDFGKTLTKSNKGKPRYEFRKVTRPTKEELNKLLWSVPTSKLAKRLGVSDKAIAKWAKSYGLSKPGRGYWGKQKSNSE